MAKIVRDTLAEFGANHPVLFTMIRLRMHCLSCFKRKVLCILLLWSNDKIVGGGGIYPTDGLPEGTCELVKMYLLPEGRGIGLGRTIIEKCLVGCKGRGL